MARILIIIGSMYGNAIETGYVCAEALRRKGHQVRTSDAPGVADLQADPDEVILVCTSTTGMGDLPDNLMPLYCQLKDAPPPLYGRRYGVIGLGDSSYDYFNGGARQMDALLADLGCERVDEPLLIDACEVRVPEKEAEKWVLKWAKKLR